MTHVPSWLTILALLLAASVVVERVKAAPTPAATMQGAISASRLHSGR